MPTMKETIQELDKLNYINISRFGTFEETGKYCTTPDEVDAIFEHIKATGKKKLLIHFHGGLVDESRGMEKATYFFNKTNDLQNTHVLNILWETGLLDALDKLFRDKNQDRLVLFINKILSFLSSRKLVQLEIDTRKIKKNVDNNSEHATEKATSQAEKHIQHNLSLYQHLKGKLLKDKISEEIQKSYPKEKHVPHTVRIIKRVVERRQASRDHGVYATIVEEALREVGIGGFGEQIWSAMKSEAFNMWQTNLGRSGMQQFVGRYLLEKLLEAQKEYGLEIHLLGHSAGSIAISECFKVIRGNEEFSDIHFQNLFFLAPAARCELFYDVIMDCEQYFDKFHLFTMTEEWELKDALVPLSGLGFVYPHSLLYFVSGLFEHDEHDAFILGLHCHIRKREPYEQYELLNQVHEWLFENPDGKATVVLSKSPSLSSLGRRCQSTAHKDYLHDDELIESIRYLVSGSMA